MRQVNSLNCTWTAHNKNETIDLSSLFGIALNTTADGYEYFLTPCENGLGCKDMGQDERYFASSDDDKDFDFDFTFWEDYDINDDEYDDDEMDYYYDMEYIDSDDYDDESIYEVMSLQTAKGKCEAYLALFDYSVNPSFGVKNNFNQFTFHYKNGQRSGVCGRGRNLSAIWKCDGTQETKITSVKENPECWYTMTIKSNLAC